MTPAPVELAYPSLLGEPFTLLGYPIETVLAEKIVTMIDRGDATTRERDFADVVTLIRRHEIGAQRLRAAIDATAEHRESILRPLREVLVTLGDERQSDWTRYVAGAGLVDLVPQSFADAIDAVADFADPILTGAIGEVRVPHGVPRAAGPSQAFPSRGGLYPARLCPDCAWAQSAPRLRHRSCRWGDVAVTNNSSVVSTVGATAAVGESAIGSTPAPS